VSSNTEAAIYVTLHLTQFADGSLDNTREESEANILVIPNAILAHAHSQLVIQHLLLRKWGHSSIFISTSEKILQGPTLGKLHAFSQWIIQPLLFTVESVPLTASY